MEADVSKDDDHSDKGQKTCVDVNEDKTDAVKISVHENEEDSDIIPEESAHDATSFKTVDNEKEKNGDTKTHAKDEVIKNGGNDKDNEDTLPNAEASSALPSPAKSIHYNISNGLKLAIIINNVDFSIINRRLFHNSGKTLTQREGSDKDVIAIKVKLFQLPTPEVPQFLCYSCPQV